MSATDTAIAVAPILDALQPLITAAVSTAVAGVVGLAIALYNSWKWRGCTIDAAHQKLIQDAAANEAAKIVAGADTALFGRAKITVASPIIEQAAEKIIGADAANLKAALDATGATKELVASLVTGEIGKLQAKIVGAAAPAAASAPPAPAASANAGA